VIKINYYDRCEFCEEEFKDEQAEEIRKLLTDMANEKVKEIISDYETWKDIHRKQRESIRKLRKKISELEIEKETEIRKLNEEIEKVKSNQKNKDELKKELVNGFETGDKAYWINKKTIYKKCDECNGIGKVEMKYKGEIKKVDCPVCGNSYGNKIKDYCEYKIESGYINSIYFDVGYKKGEFFTVGDIGSDPRVYFRHKNDCQNLNKLYHTKEEAEKAIEKKKEEDND